MNRTKPVPSWFINIVIIIITTIIMLIIIIIIIIIISSSSSSSMNSMTHGRGHGAPREGGRRLRLGEGRLRRQHRRAHQGKFRKQIG